MQISIPDGKCRNDFAINKKHIILVDSLRALLWSVTCVCGYVVAILGVTEGTGKTTFIWAINRSLHHILFPVYFPFDVLLSSAF